MKFGVNSYQKWQYISNNSNGYKHRKIILIHEITWKKENDSNLPNVNDAGFIEISNDQLLFK